MNKTWLSFVLFLAPAAAFAHAGQQGLVLLLPTEIYIVSGGLVVAATVALAALMDHDSLHRLFCPRTLLALPAPWTVGPSLISTLVFFGLVWLGLFGPYDPLGNLMTLGLWTVLWIGVVILCGLFGNIWAWLNPWSGLFRLLSGPDPSPPLTLPDRVGCWPAVVLLLMFNGFGIASANATDPRVLAILASLYWMFTFVMMMLFGAQNWLRRGEFLSVFIGLVARISPFKRGVSLRLGLPAWRIAEATPPSLSRAIFALVLLGTGTFDGLNETFFWLVQLGINPLEFPGRSAIVPQTLAGLFLTNIGLCLLFFLCVWSTAPAQRTGILFRRQALTILPIALAYHFAHFLPAILVNGQNSLVALSNPLGNGADYLNLGPFFVTTGFFNTTATVRAIFLSQAGAIVVGHVLAILLSHRIASDYFKSRSAILISQLPLSAFMIGYTILGLWLLATAKGA
ncbi:hypothetical protein [Neptunicoccus cionae]|uniref:Uncharacterized protein n=1 Tax=Neptunicoccus cionae TaxID=2035344 RepID=A0A916VNC8_9RHOB|nr:hypothetical protein [Amylibacter cionae]GGA12784.1 hypothetical protein GCM10011498_10870 [Amylibacter cionae]